MLNIQHRNIIFEKLAHLKKDTPPLFGKMSSQHMVEHLSFVVTFSNGKLPQQLLVPEQKAKVIKHYTIDTSNEMSIGFKAPMLGDELPSLNFSTLNEAVQNLKKELDDFDSYFKTNPHSKPMSAVLGVLNHKEWIIFHNKHFTHHFKQFGLL